MTYLYFSCDWIIRPVGNGRNLFKVVEIGHELNCHILSKELSKDDNGYYVAHLVIRTLSTGFLKIFLEEVRQYIELINCRATDEDQFKGTPIVPMGPSAVDAMRSLNEIAQHNEAIRYRLSNQDRSIQ